MSVGEPTALWRINSPTLAIVHGSELQSLLLRGQAPPDGSQLSATEPLQPSTGVTIPSIIQGRLRQLLPSRRVQRSRTSIDMCLLRVRYEVSKTW
jgi:hypothetical protein